MKCLVIVICQTRAHRTVWNSFKTNVIDSLGADLALCVSKTGKPDPFRESATYLWEYDDPTDWAAAYDQVQRELGSTKPWRQVLDIDTRRQSCLFGGIKHHPNIVGSGAVLFWYRWKVLENIKRLGLTSQYDWFIVTRSDYLYDVPHVPLEMLSPNSVWIPDGEKYGGVTDRHLICPSKFLERSIDMLRYILTAPEHLVANYSRWMQGKPMVNPETFIAYYLNMQGIPVRFVPYFMYVVRELDEIRNPTSGDFRHAPAYLNTNYSIKYTDEKRQADRLQIRSPADWRGYLA
jgi:hypothetical protein